MFKNSFRHEININDLTKYFIKISLNSLSILNVVK